MTTHHSPFCVVAPVAGLLLIGCSSPTGGGPESGHRHQAITAPTTIEFDEQNLAPGTILTDQYRSLGLVFAPDTRSVVRIGDAGALGVWPTPSGAMHLALDTTDGSPPAAVLTATFHERGTGVATTADAVSVWIVDSDALPLPRATIVAFDAAGQAVEVAGTTAEIERVVFAGTGIAGLRFIDEGSDGLLIDDLQFTLADDVDGDGVANSIDRCPLTPGGPPVDAAGCACDQRLVFECPPGDPWKNHGAYVSCVAHAAGACADDALVTDEGKSDRVVAAAHSQVGKKMK